MTFTTAEEVIQYIEDEEVEYVDIRFSDLPGVQQHFSIPAQGVQRGRVRGGLAFDGSSVRGFQSIHESDMLLLPDFTTARIDPFRAAKTLNMDFFVHDPFTREAYSRDPRNIARKAEEYLVRPASPTPRTSVPRPSSTSSTRSATTPAMNGSFYEMDSDLGCLEHRQGVNADGSPTSATRSTTRVATSPSPVRPLRRPARRDLDQPAERGLRARARRTTRSAPPVRPRSTTSSTRCSRRPTTCSCSSTS